MSKSLEQRNEERIKRHRRLASNEPRPNGLACPECGHELVDSHPNVTLTSSPPQKNVACPGCGYAGYRIA